VVVVYVGLHCVGFGFLRGVFVTVVTLPGSWVALGSLFSCFCVCCLGCFDVVSWSLGCTLSLLRVGSSHQFSIGFAWWVFLALFYYIDVDLVCCVYLFLCLFLCLVFYFFFAAGWLFFLFLGLLWWYASLRCVIFFLFCVFVVLLVLLVFGCFILCAVCGLLQTSIVYFFCFWRLGLLSVSGSLGGCVVCCVCCIGWLALFCGWFGVVFGLVCGFSARLLFAH